ncbi:MAG: hypothetical protein IJJ28_04010 [Lentisphaeria bacterium]|nr:hypothetical protein [Lentisphaeria bacterium]
MKLRFWFPVPIWLLFAGCAVDNNYLHPEDFAEYLRRDGMTVENVRKLPPDPFSASDAAAIKVANSEIGVYKFDTTARVQRARLERIAEVKRMYITGIPFPVKVQGSFVFFGLERNPAKRKILKTIEKFK